MKIKPSLSKGTRDFLPSEVAKRNYIFDTIKSVFRKYGFEQIETPAIEKLETLTGKYGEEGDKLLFKILNSGDYLAEVRNQKSAISELEPQEITPLIAEKGLRYDLTVPLARYVVQHQDQLAFPFKRFHIGPVWRADRPQKGRYQEFYQCDADVIGSSSLLNEVELLKIYAEVFEKLRIANCELRINNRKLLEGLAEYHGLKDHFESVITGIDKLDKITKEQLLESYVKLGMPSNSIDSLKNLIEDITLKSDLVLTDILDGKKKTTIGQVGAKELNFVYESFIKNYSGQVKITKDYTLARGLNYYTGLIVEVKINGFAIGSLGGGGRYDNLTEIFGGQNMSGVGISFGIERIYDMMEELNLFPEHIAEGVKVLLVPRDSQTEEYTFRQVQTLRDAGIPAEIFLGNVKKQKQFAYAEQKGISYIVEIGANEMESGNFRLRHVKERQEVGSGFTLSELLQKLS